LYDSYNQWYDDNVAQKTSPPGHCGYCYDGKPREYDPDDPDSIGCKLHTWDSLDPEDQMKYLVWDSTHKAWTHPDEGCPDYDDPRFYDKPTLTG
jgi:hypothetical protein